MMLMSSSTSYRHGCYSNVVLALGILLLQSGSSISKSFVGVTKHHTTWKVKPSWTMDDGNNERIRWTSTVPSSSRLSSSLLSELDSLESWKRQSLYTVRGGGDSTVTTTSTSTSTSTAMGKVRNALRSLIQLCERKLSPQWAKSLQRAIHTVETIIGVPLLSTSSNLITDDKLKRKKKKKRKSTTSLSTKEEEEMSPSETDDEAAASTTTTTKSAKGKRKSKNSKKKKSTSLASNDDNDNNEVAAAAKKETLSSSNLQHLTSNISRNNPNYRIQRELKEFLRDPPPNISVQVGKNIRIWIATLQGVGIYKGEVFKLRIQFPPTYPMVPPSVYFLHKPKIPIHEHVYTNGDICLSLLGDGWRPTMTAQSIAVSILSILASAQSKALPMDNARHAQNKPGQYQKDWVYHDDNC